MDQFLRDGKKNNKYNFMDEGDKVDHASLDVKQKAQKFAEKTQRALQAPLSHLVIQPRDERLIEDESPHSLNLQNENGVLNDSFTHNSKYNGDITASGPSAVPVGVPIGNKMRPKRNNGSRNQPVVPDVRDNRVHSDPTVINRNPVRRAGTGVGGNRPNSMQPASEHRRNHSNSSAANVYMHPFYQQFPTSAPAVDPGDIRFNTFPLNDFELPGSGDMKFRSSDSLMNVDTRKLPKKGDYLSFHNIVYKVKTKKFPWSKPVSKTILNNISGIMMPGVNAIMGPTGSGKSSILDVLAGRKDPRYLDGKVHINGSAQPKNFKCMSGYVVQDDIVMGTLTVKENLMFSAALRLPVSKTKAQKEDMVKSLIDELGLTAVANSRIGTELLRGVSGGERKRTNIGMELITDPKVLFLDEPTTGLDAFTAASVIKTLQKLSRKGKTVVLSIHQPKYSIYKLFDRYTLMAKGKIVYHGKAGSAPINYFHNLGYYIEPHNNPADFYIDILNGEVSNEKELLDQQRLESSGEFSDARNLGRNKSDLRAKKAIVDNLVNRWEDSVNCKELRNQLHQYDTIVEDEYEPEVKSGRHGIVSGLTGTDNTITYATPWTNQLNWVCWRTALNLLRNPQTSSIQLGVYLFFAFSMGIVYFGQSKLIVAQQDRYGLFFFATLQVMFVNLGAIEIFIKERPIFIHENSSGYYRVSSYFFAKLLCDMIPIKVFPAIIFLPITYFMAKLRLDAGAFFYFELILLLATAAGCSIAFFTSATFSVFGLANVVTPIIYVFMMVFSGYLISIDSVFNWLNWCRWLSAFRYALAGLSINEMKGETFCLYSNNTVCEGGEAFLERNSIAHKTAWDLWVNPFGLAAISLFFLILCYVQLRRINKFK